MVDMYVVVYSEGIAESQNIIKFWYYLSSVWTVEYFLMSILRHVESLVSQVPDLTNIAIVVWSQSRGPATQQSQSQNQCLGIKGIRSLRA